MSKQPFFKIQSLIPADIVCDINENYNEGGKGYSIHPRDINLAVCPSASCPWVIEEKHGKEGPYHIITLTDDAWENNGILEIIVWFMRIFHCNLMRYRLLPEEKCVKLKNKDGIVQGTLEIKDNHFECMILDDGELKRVSDIYKTSINQAYGRIVAKKPYKFLVPKNKTIIYRDTAYSNEEEFLLNLMELYDEEWAKYQAGELSLRKLTEAHKSFADSDDCYKIYCKLCEGNGMRLSAILVRQSRRISYAKKLRKASKS